MPIHKNSIIHPSTGHRNTLHNHNTIFHFEPQRWQSSLDVRSIMRKCFYFFLHYKLMVFVLDYSRKKKNSPGCCHAQKNWRAPKSLQALQKSFAQQQPTRMLVTGPIAGIQLCFSSCYWKGRWLLAQHRRVETLNAPKLASVLGSSPKGKT